MFLRDLVPSVSGRIKCSIVKAKKVIKMIRNGLIPNILASVIITCELAPETDPINPPNSKAIGQIDVG